MAVETGNGHLGNTDAAPALPEPIDPTESVPPPSAPPPVTPEPQPEPPTRPSPAAPVTPPPPGWYRDLLGNPARWWDGSAWTEHVLAAPPASEPPQEEPKLNFFDEALISFSLAPDWAKFLAAAAVTAVIALIGFGILNGDSGSDETPDGFVPQTPELDDGALPGAPSTPEPAEPDDSTSR